MPHWKSESQMTIPAGSRLQWLRSADGWALVEFASIGKIQGWVDLSNVLSKLDFAQFILTADKKWMAINHREGSSMVAILRNGDRIEVPLTQIHGVMTAPDLGVSLTTDDSKHLLLRQNLRITKTQADHWTVSQLSGHGEVFWKAQMSAKNTAAANTVQNPEHFLTTEELLKREVTSFSFHPKKTNFGLASSEGIFLTTDGKNWKRLFPFKKQNHAVLIDEFGILYVGDQRSLDGGKNFQQYFLWEKLAQLLEQKLKRPPGKIHIQNLAVPRPGLIQMNLQTDNGQLKLASRNSTDLLNNWDFF
jgi:hypothetical protein